MITVSNNDPLPLSEFQIGDYIFTPDFGTVDIRITDSKGVVVHETSVSFDADFSIPQDLLTVSGSEVLSFFKLTVKFSSENRLRIFTDIIRVYTEILITVQPSQVRTLLGLFSEELPDEEIDFIGSYSELVEDIGETFLEDTSARINKLILLHEAMRHAVSLELKTLKSNELDDTKKSRLSSINIPALQKKIESQYWAHKLTFEGVDPLPEENLIEFITRTDPFTGEDS
tara:strand:+ start:11018 stop:11704 length:687 start_codon:yes stop_codon:yes gene_type:complete